jgi:hypothetical protein
MKWIYFIIYIIGEETEVESYHTLQRVKAWKLTENRKHGLYFIKAKDLIKMRKIVLLTYAASGQFDMTEK